MDKMALFFDVKENVEAYRDFLERHNALDVNRWEDIPIMNKENYLLYYPMEKTVRKGDFDNCFLIGASSGFSKTGTIYWPKRAEDEKGYIKASEEALKELYGIHKKRTLIIVALAFGMWIGGMQLACMVRRLAAESDYPLTCALVGFDIEEAANIAKRFEKDFEQILFITNPSNVSVIYSLVKDNKNLLNGRVYFAVVGEYFSEFYRREMTLKFGHTEDAKTVLWTGYGSADTGALAVETVSTISLRRYLTFDNQSLKQELFGDGDTPMIMEPSKNAFVEIVDGNIVATLDQLTPLIRYNTKDKGKLLYKEELKGKIDDKLFESLPDVMLCIFGRASNSIVFYGTNLTIPKIDAILYSIEDKIHYSGLFEVEKIKKGEIDVFRFTVYSFEDKKDKEEFVKNTLIENFKKLSREFAAKYDNLSKAAGFDLIEVEIKRISKNQASKKHRHIKS
ncbi:phenylacetate--CoA ligase [Hippea alviniae]|uniref:phenylacetate--CoA ligase n=1 Tax=Hippea alviniae TaxID=1279027 RepID=UPI0003B445CA|nr:phenylacetate--CoA ligase [Hippea alviniae]